MCQSHRSSIVIRCCRIFISCESFELWGTHPGPTCVALPDRMDRKAIVSVAAAGAAAAMLYRMGRSRTSKAKAPETKSSKYRFPVVVRFALASCALASSA